MKVWAVSEFEPMASTEIEKVFDSKEKAFNFNLVEREHTI